MTYTDTLRSLDMFTKMLSSSEVKWFGSADFPLNMRFLTVTDELYDVTYMDNSNWINKSAMLPIAWRQTVPRGQEDPFNHIAVVPSIEMAQKLQHLAFTQFVVLDSNGGVAGVYDNA